MGLICETHYPVELVQVRGKIPIIVTKVDNRASSEDAQYVIVDCMEPFILDTTLIYTKHEIMSRAEDLCSILVEELRERVEGRFFCWMVGCVISPLHASKETADLQEVTTNSRIAASATGDIHQGKGISVSMRYVCEFGIRGIGVGGFMMVDDALARADGFEPTCPGIDKCRHLYDGVLVRPPRGWVDGSFDKSLLFDDTNACDGDCLYANDATSAEPKESNK